MSIELPKAYEPTDVETRWYPFWLSRRATSRADASSTKPPYSHRPAAAQRHRLAAPGPRAHRDHPGHPDALEADERLQRALAAGHRPRRHRHPDGGGEGAQEDREARRATTWAARSSSSASGRGRRSTAPASASSTRCWAPRSTGAASASPWTSGSSAAVRRSSCASTKRACIYRARAADQLVPRVPHRALRPRGGARGEERQPLGDRLPGEGQRSEAGGRHHPPRDDAGRHRGGHSPRRPALRGRSHGKTVVLPLLDREIPIIADAQLVSHGVRHRRGEGDARARPQRLRDRPAATALPMISIFDERAQVNENGGPYAGPRPLRGAQEGARGPRRAGPAGEARSRTSSPSAPASAAARWWSRACRRSGS